MYHIISFFFFNYKEVDRRERDKWKGHNCVYSHISYIQCQYMKLPLLNIGNFSSLSVPTVEDSHSSLDKARRLRQSRAIVLIALGD